MKVLNTSDRIRTAHIEGCVTLDEEQLKQLQSTLLSMLKDISTVMEENKISYSLGGGSVLGAVRHNGFIPWDDDIDINIPRSEFERFLPLFEERFGDRYWIHVPGRTKGYALLFPQIRLKGTSVRTRDDLNNDECGACIDFFYMENTYDNGLKRFIHGFGCQYHGFAVSCRKFYRDRKGIIDFAKKTADQKLLRAARIKVFCGFFFALCDIDKMVKRADKWNGKCKDTGSGYVVFPAGRNHFFGELYRRNVAFPGERKDFENLRIPCPSDPDSYLKHLYGEYMNIPQVADRESHIFFEPFTLS